MSTQWCGYLIILQYGPVFASCEFFSPQSCPPTWCENNITGVGNGWATPNSGFISTLVNTTDFWFMGEHKKHGGPSEDAAETHWMCGREQEKTMKRKSGITMQSLAGTVRQQLMLRNLAILFMFFQHKQVLGSPGWEGHADKKKKEEPLFVCVCVIYSDESFYRQALFLESARMPK